MKISTNAYLEEDSILSELNSIFNKPVFIKSIIGQHSYFRKSGRLCYILRYANSYGDEPGWVQVHEVMGSYSEKVPLDSCIHISEYSQTMEFVTKYRNYKISHHPA
jgi:hypothetical protein